MTPKVCRSYMILIFSFKQKIIKTKIFILLHCNVTSLQITRVVSNYYVLWYIYINIKFHPLNYMNQFDRIKLLKFSPDGNDDTGKLEQMLHSK